MFESLSIDQPQEPSRMMTNSHPPTPLRVASSVGRPGRVAVTVLLLLATACGAPIGVKRANPQLVHQRLTADVLSSGQLSVPTWNRLRAHGLDETWEKDPEGAIRLLQRELGGLNASSGDWFALAETSFLYAQKHRARSYFLASAVYAWAYLFPEPPAQPPNPFDQRLRTAADIYNRGLTEAFEVARSGDVAVEPGLVQTPFGTVNVQLSHDASAWQDRTLSGFVPVAELEIFGLRNRYRQPGIGAPLAASANVLPDSAIKSKDHLDVQEKVSVTALLTVDRPRSQVLSGHVEGRIQLYPGRVGKAVTIDGREVPLEAEPTAALAATLAESPIWEREIKGFFFDLLGASQTPNLLFSEPYERGKIPVVLVHGTASSSGRWADMLNDLSNDHDVSDRYTFWMFTYDTGAPVAYSSMLLRKALTEVVDKLDPQGTDPALRRMVVIGHSQGGLLTKMTAVDSGDAFWKQVSRKSFDEVKLSDEDRGLLQYMMFVKPLPFVHRVIFLATPHGGSYLTLFSPARWLRSFIKLPSTILKTGTTLLTLNRDAIAMGGGTGRIPTALDNMTPGNPFLKALHDTPVAPGVAANSVIAVQGGNPADGGVDGVVKYESAHVDGVESELVVDSSHSLQSNPFVIAEVRRILLVNAGLIGPDVGRVPPGTPAAGWQDPARPLPVPISLPAGAGG
ncbi:MAG: esterase/lipase family protein [Alphaproteobacteria bacterium]